MMGWALSLQSNTGKTPGDINAPTVFPPLSPRVFSYFSLTLAGVVVIILSWWMIFSLTPGYFPGRLSFSNAEDGETSLGLTSVLLTEDVKRERRLVFALRFSSYRTVFPLSGLLSLCSRFERFFLQA